MKSRHNETLPYSIDALYEVVADIDSYKNFLPWCINSKVIKREKDHLLADLTIGYGMIRETYTSKVTLDFPHKIEIESIKGPFSHLKSCWMFKEVGENETQVSFFIDIKIRNPLLEMAFKAALEMAFPQIIKSFEERIRQSLDSSCAS